MMMMMMMINTPPASTTTTTTASNPSSTSSSNNIAAGTVQGGGGGGGGNNKAMVQQQQQQQHQDPLKCPRCYSSNTKFCYYNNYSLSQPRHFCKACKRYWTRGGTLRNVPVGGGCRKNNKRRSKKHQPLTTTTTTKSVGPKVDPAPPLNLPTATCSDLRPFFYRSATTTTTTSDMNSLGSFSGVFQPQLSAFGHGGLISSTGGFNNVSLSDHMIQPSAMTLLSDQYFPSFTSQAESLLVSSLKQPKMVDDYNQSMLPYENLGQANSNIVNLGLMKEDQVTVEGNNNNNNNNNNNRESEWPVIPTFDSTFSVNSSSDDVATGSDSSYLFWNSSAILGSGSGWTDATNSSLAPLI